VSSSQSIEYYDKYIVSHSQTLNIVDMAIHPVVRKIRLSKKCDFQNSKKLDPIQITTKKFQARICLPFKDNLLQEIGPWCITKV
jgi:hypothetical protein